MAKFRKRWARVGVRQVTTQPADNDSAGAFLFQRQPPSRGEEQGLQSKHSLLTTSDTLTSPLVLLLMRRPNQTHRQPRNPPRVLPMWSGSGAAHGPGLWNQIRRMINLI